MNILILSEKHAFSKLLSKVLSSQGHDLMIISDGYKALEYAKESKPDLIIMDVLLSYVTAFEFIDEIRNIDKKYIYIILLTEVKVAQLESEVLSLGIDEFLVMPVDLQYVSDLVSKYSSCMPID